MLAASATRSRPSTGAARAAWAEVRVDERSCSGRARLPRPRRAGASAARMCGATPRPRPPPRRRPRQRAHSPPRGRETTELEVAASARTLPATRPRRCTGRDRGRPASSAPRRGGGARAGRPWSASHSAASAGVRASPRQVVDERRLRQHPVPYETRDRRSVHPGMARSPAAQRGAPGRMLARKAGQGDDGRARRPAASASASGHHLLASHRQHTAPVGGGSAALRLEHVAALPARPPPDEGATLRQPARAPQGDVGRARRSQAQPVYAPQRAGADDRYVHAAPARRAANRGRWWAQRARIRTPSGSR